MGRMVDGIWKSGVLSANEAGEFKRQATAYHGFVRADGSTEFAPEAGRYHLFAAHACPWANRTLILRRLKGLDDAIDVSFVAPAMGTDGWIFDEEHRDHLFGHAFLREVYLEGDEHYTGRVTVPVLWDKKLGRIVNNESREVIRMFDHEFRGIATNDTDFAPADLLEQVDETITAIYEPINNGVYRSGFATAQSFYDTAVTELFEALDHWEEILGSQRYLCGDRMTEADVCLFTTLIRFDLVYHGHFKCNLRRIGEYKNLSAYTRDMFQTPGVGDTIDFDKIKSHYYWSHESVNPHRIVPKGPLLDFSAPHGREALSSE